MRLLLPLARSVAKNSHHGQVDKAGRDYFSAHVQDVVTRVGDDRVSRAVAYLHDVVEDANVTLDDLRFEGFPEVVVDAVDAITRRDGEHPDDYYARVRANALALAVKKADIESNTDPERVGLLDPKTRERLARKYTHARKVLGL